MWTSPPPKCNPCFRYPQQGDPSFLSRAPFAPPTRLDRGHPYHDHFRSRKRNWELRLQGKFKKAILVGLGFMLLGIWVGLIFGVFRV